MPAKNLSQRRQSAAVSRTDAGFSGADLANLLNEAAILAARKNKKLIEIEDCFEAVGKSYDRSGKKKPHSIRKRKKDYRLS